MDLAFMRFILGFIADWPSVYHEAFKILRPDAYLERHEVARDPQFEDGSITPSILSAGDKLGKSYRAAYNTKKWMEEVGFVNVVEVRFSMPMAGWPADPELKELGMWFRAYFDGIEGCAMALLTDFFGSKSCMVRGVRGSGGPDVRFG